MTLRIAEGEFLLLSGYNEGGSACHRSMLAVAQDGDSLRECG